MKNLWDDQEAAGIVDDLQQRVYTSRLLGRDSSLVLHGGGNTSVKIEKTNLVGETEQLLCVKGSGWDLQTIDVPGFPEVKLDHLIKLAALDSLSDPQMVNELRTHMNDASAPTPSVEAILHATLPYKFVDHTHADAVVTITNTPNGLEAIRAIYGDSVVVVPYIMPGFDLARLCAIEFEKQRNPNTIGMVLMNHGIFSFGDTAKEAYERMIALVGKAEVYIQDKGAWELDYPVKEVPAAQPLELAKLRQAIAGVAGFPVLLRSLRDERTMSFCRRDDLSHISQQGPATPDHVIRTKRIPMLGRDAESYAAAYAEYFDTHAPNARDPKTMLDPAPRVVLDSELGMLTVGRSMKEAAINADIYEHTMDIIARAERMGGWQALPSQDIFDMEYWDLEQAKLKKSGSAPVFSGEIALVTGAASGIGKACVESLLARGASVIALDIDPAMPERFQRADVLGLICDVGDEQALVDAVQQGVAHFGGLDMLVLNAGIFPGGCRIDSLDSAAWRKVMQINLDANLVLMREAHPFLALAPKGGRVVALGSKNFLAPGPGAVAYSSSKAALTQMMRVAALEWGGENIRVNVMHPDCVFDTGIWTDEVLAARAGHYGLTVDEYKRKNILKAEVTSHDVGELCAEMCGPLFAKTTAAQVPIDGGNDRVI